MLKQKKRLAVLTGAGISAESGIATFRSSDGLWEQYRIEDVATPQAWRKNPSLVLEFYNLRRQKAAQALPNAAHYALQRLEETYNVSIVTQNVDDLHERAGSRHVLHLHGKLSEVRSVLNPALIYDIGDKPIFLGDTCTQGGQLRPNIVWFGEDVPMIDNAVEIVRQADIFLVIGTSLLVYPAAGLLHHVPKHAPIYLIDPEPNAEILHYYKNLIAIPEKATVGMEKLLELLSNSH